MKYSMKCTCGDVNTVDAQTREEAVQMFKDQMTPEAVAAHFAEKHPGDPVPSQEEVAQNIEASVVEGDLSVKADMPAGAADAGTGMGDAQPVPTQSEPAVGGDNPEEENKA